MFALIVEDSLELAEILRHLMEMKGIEAAFLRNGTDALEFLSRITPDLVMLDLHLPGASGLDILKRLKADSRFINTRIVTMTGDVNRVYELKAIAEVVLVKPFLYDDLIKATDHLLAG